MAPYPLKTYTITLPEYPDRARACAEHFESVGLQTTFINGVSGIKAGLMTRHTYDLDRATGYSIESKHVGMVLSHWTVWQICLQQPDAFFMVCEDDCIFPENWRNRYYAALRDVPEDMDILLFGHCNAADKPTTHVVGEIFDVRYPHCTHAMVIAKKAIPKLMETQTRIWAPIDIALAVDSYPHLKVFTVLPRLCEQRGTNLSL